MQGLPVQLTPKCSANQSPLNISWLHLMTFLNVQRQAKINSKQDTMLLGPFPGICLRFMSSSHLPRKEAISDFHRSLKMAVNVLSLLVASSCSSRLHELWGTPWGIRVTVDQNQDCVQLQQQGKNLSSGCRSHQGCPLFQITWTGSQGAGTAKVRITSQCVQTTFVCQPL